MTTPATIAADGQTREEFDPRSIPAYPVVNVRLLTDDDGHVVGEVDGEPVPVDEDDPIASLMGHAQDAATKRPMRAVRVTATDLDDRTWPMVVHADGRTWDLDSTPAPQRPGLSRRLAAALTAGTLALAGVCLGGSWWIASRQDSAPPPTPTAAPPGEAPVVPVTGWARRAAWVSPAIAVPSDGDPLIVTDSTILTTTEAGSTDQLTALRPTDGATLWSTPLDGRATTAPQLVEQDGRDAVAVATRDSLTIWPNGQAAPDPTTWPLPQPGLELVPTSRVPLLADTDAHTALVMTGTSLESRVLPADAQPLAGTSTGAVLAADNEGNWWSLTNETTAPAPQRLPRPTKDASAASLLGATGDTLLYAWAARDGSTIVAAYDLSDEMAPLWDTSIYGNHTDPDALDVSPDGTWATLDNAALDTATGALRLLPEDWQTTRITNEAAYSTSGDGIVAPKMQPADDLGLDDLDPEGIPVATAEGRGLIVAETDQTSRIYALEPDHTDP